MAPPASGLGTITKFASIQNSSGSTDLAQRYTRLESRYRDQDQARRLLPHERVALCLRALLPQLATVEVWGDRLRCVAHFRNLTLCGSVWMCPVCASNIAEIRRCELDRAIVVARERGWIVALETLTARHYRDYALRPLLSSLLEARRAFVSGRLRVEASGVYGLLGRVTSLEATRTLEHGWHPHFHSLLFFAAAADLRAYEARMADAWVRVLRRMGLDGNGYAYKLQPTYGAVADYVSKWGHEPAYAPWGVAAELTKWHVKRGRLSSSMTPFQLLQASQDIPEAGSLFQEYAGAFKGRHQLQWSRGLRADLLGEEEEMSDQEAAKGSADDQRAMLAMLLAHEWNVIKANGARGELLRSVLLGDDELLTFLQTLGLRL